MATQVCSIVIGDRTGFVGVVAVDPAVRALELVIGATAWELQVSRVVERQRARRDLLSGFHVLDLVVRLHETCADLSAPRLGTVDLAGEAIST